MGNHHSEQEQQSKANAEAKPESSPKPKKDTDIWSGFRSKTKASTMSQTSPFKPVPPNLFKGIPDFSGTGTSSLCKQQLPLEPPSVEEKPLDGLPAMPVLLPPAAHTPNQLWGPKEPSAYNISWERPNINSPMPSPISSFAFPSVPENTPHRDFQKAVPHPTTATSASPATPVASPASPATPVASPRANVSAPRPKTPPRLPKKASPEPLPPVKPAMPQQPNLPQQPATPRDPTLPQKSATSQRPVVKDGVKEPTQDGAAPFLFTAATSEKTQDPQQSATPTADHKTSSADKSDKPPASEESNTAASTKDSKNDDKVKKQTFVISEETHAEIMSRLAYVEKQKLLSDAPVAQKLAVVRKALNGVSYAEAVKKSQPKVNHARREARAIQIQRLVQSKKVKTSKTVVKQAQTQTVANPVEGGSDVPQQPANNSSASHLPLKGAPDLAVTHKSNVKAAPEQMEHLHQNEQPAIVPVDIELEKRILADVNDAISRMICPEHGNLTQNPPPFCRTGNPRKSQPGADVKATSASSHQSKASQMCQSRRSELIVETVLSSLQDSILEQLKASEQISRTDKEKGKHSVKCVPLPTNSKPGLTEDSAALDTSAELRGCSDVSTTPCELSNATGASEEPQKPLITPHKPATSAVARRSTSHITGSSKDMLCASTNEQCTLTAEAGSPTLFAHPSPPNVSAQVHHHHTKTTLPAQACKEQAKAKPPNKSAPKLTNAETSDKHKHRQERLLVPVPPPPSPQPPPPARPEGRWHPFTTDRSCVQKVRCQHRQNGSLPKNVMQWLNASRNHLCEPSWVTTASLAASIALSARLDREDSRQ